MSPLLNTANKVYHGTSLADAVYAGSVKVWPGDEPGPAPAAKFWFNSEGSTEGATVGVGQAYRDPWNGATGANTYRAASAKNGTRGIQLDPANTPGLTQWNNGTGHRDHSVGFWLKIGSAPSVEGRILDLRETSSAGTVGGLVIDTSRYLKVMSGTAGSTTGQYQLALNTWYWVNLLWSCATSTRLMVYDAAGALLHNAAGPVPAATFATLATTRWLKPTTYNPGSATFMDDICWEPDSLVALAPWLGGTPPAYVKPDATNTGTTGTLTPLNGNQVITVAGTVLENRDINGKVQVQAANVVIRNCRIRGGAAPTGTQNWGLISAYYDTTVNLLVEDCELVPDNVAVGWTGILGHDYTARRCNVYNTVDGFGVYDTTVPAGDMKVTLESNYVHDLAYLSPDPNHGDNHTHNDCVQIQGGYSGTVLRGNTLNCNAGPASNTQSPYYPSCTGQALGLTPVVSAIRGVIIEDNWLNYGAQILTIAEASRGATTTAEVRGNKFGRQSNSNRSIVADPELTIPTLPTVTGPDISGNVYEDDGLPVTVYRTNDY